MEKEVQEGPTKKKHPLWGHFINVSLLVAQLIEEDLTTDFMKVKAKT